ncbi:M17 family peptidase N-terminal domain-containing protein [Hyalangium rubrum]|uniref:M17 family peptidase N-terminal domain-containing protein n=1 Tax=Hyalangium rubrum TaxID=3103134 RepID=A0ABU5H8X1_9BACT|nr:M17 family peptidase N-terminal domain-containing protein [Hyalangium sp. s54d21]MDY7229938.1 M17 family peptidase N-terminal domain-containing protein [Hyalangium sp. s54d21]
MNVTAHEIGFEGLDTLAGVDALCLFVAEDDRPLPGTAGYVDWRLCGDLSRVLKAEFFTGVKDDWLLLPTDGRLPFPRIFAVGMGPRKSLTPEALGKALASAARVLAKAKVESVALEIPGGGEVDEAAQAAALQQHFLPGFKGKRVSLLADKGLARLLPGRKS